MFKNKVLKTIEKYELLNKNDNVLVALSGGSDSVSLLTVLLLLKNEYALNIEAAHINHSLREEADDDTEFVKQLCKKNNVKLHILKEDIKTLSKKWGYSEEKTGRIVRYDFFDKIVGDTDMKIATAHTKDDCAENFLIGALRGTTPKGIPPKRGNIIRPLIEITKNEIYEFLCEQNQAFVEDKTNFIPDYTRNKIRLEIIPCINEKFHTNFANNVYNSLDVSYFEDDFMIEETKKQIDKICCFYTDKTKININEFNKLHIALKRRIIREIYYRFTENEGFVSHEHVFLVIKICENKKTGKKIELPQGIEATVCYDELVFSKKDSNSEILFEYEVTMNENVYVPYLKKTININDKGIGVELFSSDNNFTVRNRRPSDKVYINNVGHKKLKSLMIDKKIPQSKRNKLLVISDDDGIAYVEEIYKRKNNNDKKLYVYIGE